MWDEVDPTPAGFVDRMVAAVAVEDITREYAMLTLVSNDALAGVRGEADTSTLQFSDGEVSVLVHITATQGGGRRLDGWADAEPLAIRLAQGERGRSADPGEHGRFSFDGMQPGMSRLRLVVRGVDGDLREFQTPQFEV